MMHSASLVLGSRTSRLCATSFSRGAIMCFPLYLYPNGDIPDSLFDRANRTLSPDVLDAALERS